MAKPNWFAHLMAPKHPVQANDPPLHTPASACQQHQGQLKAICPGVTLSVSQRHPASSTPWVLIPMEARGDTALDALGCVGAEGSFENRLQSQECWLYRNIVGVNA